MGLTEVDNGREGATGAFGAKKLEGAGAIPVSRTGNWIRTVACGFTLGCGGFVTGGCGN